MFLLLYVKIREIHNSTHVVIVFSIVFINNLINDKSKHNFIIIICLILSKASLSYL